MHVKITKRVCHCLHFVVSDMFVRLLLNYSIIRIIPVKEVVSQYRQSLTRTASAINSRAEPVWNTTGIERHHLLKHMNIENDNLSNRHGA